MTAPGRLSAAIKSLLYCSLVEQKRLPKFRHLHLQNGSTIPLLRSALARRLDLLSFGKRNAVQQARKAMRRKLATRTCRANSCAPRCLDSIGHSTQIGAPYRPTPKRSLPARTRLIRRTFVFLEPREECSLVVGRSQHRFGARPHSPCPTLLAERRDDRQHHDLGVDASAIR